MLDFPTCEQLKISDIEVEVANYRSINGHLMRLCWFRDGDVLDLWAGCLQSYQINVHRRSVLFLPFIRSPTALCRSNANPKLISYAASAEVICYANVIHGYDDTT